MKKSKNKSDLIGIAQTVAIASVGGYVGDIITTESEKMLVKSNPKYSGLAPAVTSALGIAGLVMTEKNTMVNDFLLGVSIASGTELISTMINKATTPKAPTTDPTVVQGNPYISRLNSPMSKANRLNANKVSNVSQMPYMAY